MAIPVPALYGDPQRTGLTAADLRDGVTEHLFFTVASTNHTLLPEALECWDLRMFGELCPPPSGDHFRDQSSFPAASAAGLPGR